MARRNVDQQIFDPSLADGLQMICDGIHMPRGDKGAPGLSHRPGQPDEVTEPASGQLRIDLAAGVSASDSSL